MVIKILPWLLLFYTLGVFGWAFWTIYRSMRSKPYENPVNKLAGTGITFSDERETETYTIRHTVEDGIERIVYTPKNRRHETPILMAHGMWHGAWCWQPWQEIFAEQGWESVAYSLPAHAKSPVQRPLRQCTLDYYLAFVRDEAARLPRKPVLMGHSMGGALSQWYLRYIGDDLPAVVLVAPWTSHNAWLDSLIPFMKLDALGSMMMLFTLDASPMVRTPQLAARALMAPGAIFSPEELHSRLNGESALVTFQQSPPMWYPPENIKTPMLLLAGEKDAVVPLEPLRKSAAFYKADFVVVPEAGHNLMMEKSYKQTARTILDWLEKKQIA